MPETTAPKKNIRKPLNKDEDASTAIRITDSLFLDGLLTLVSKFCEAALLVGKGCFPILRA